MASASQSDFEALKIEFETVKKQLDMVYEPGRGAVVMGGAPSSVCGGVRSLITGGPGSSGVVSVCVFTIIVISACLQVGASLSAHPFHA